MELRSKIREIIEGNLNAIIISALCFLFVAATSLLRVEKTGESVLAILQRTAMAFIFGVTVNWFFREEGMRRGEASDKVTEARAAYAEAARGAVGDFEGLQAFCVRMNAAALRNERMKILTRVGLSYGEWFDGDGVPKSCGYQPNYLPRKGVMAEAYRLRHNALEKARMHEVSRAITLRIREMDAAELLAEDERQGDPFNFGQGRRAFRMASTAKNMLTKVATSLIMGLYTVSMIDAFGWAGVLWSLLQVVIVIAFGCLQMMSARDYMVNGFAQRLGSKTMYIRKYLSEKESCHGGTEKSQSAE